jgi:hypothetical protein
MLRDYENDIIRDGNSIDWDPFGVHDEVDAASRDWVEMKRQRGKG